MALRGEAGMEETVVIRGLSRDEEGRKRVEKVEVKSHDPDTLRYVEKKMRDKGVHRMDRHPVHGRGGFGQPPPKSGRGGKYTWEGPDGMVEAELDPAPTAIDEGDPNYVDEEDEEEEGVVAKTAEEREDINM